MTQESDSPASRPLFGTISGSRASVPFYIIAAVRVKESWQLAILFSSYDNHGKIVCVCVCVCVCVRVPECVSRCLLLHASLICYLDACTCRQVFTFYSIQK